MTPAELSARVDELAGRLAERFRAKPVYGPAAHHDRMRRAHVGPLRRVVSMDGDFDQLECGHTVPARGPATPVRRHCPGCKSLQSYARETACRGVMRLLHNVGLEKTIEPLEAWGMKPNENARPE